MEPQPSTSAAVARASKDASCDGGTTSKSDGFDEAVVSISGGPDPVQQQGNQLYFNGRASFKQIQQLFGSTCRIQLQRYQFLPTPIIQTGNSGSIATPSAEQRPTDSTTVTKVEEETSDSAGNDSSSDDDDDVKVLRTPTPDAAAAPLPKKTRRVTKKKKGEKRVFGRKATCARCTICGKWMTKVNLKVHMRMHSGEKRYRCEHCGRSFWNPATFSSHKKARAQRNGVCPGEKKRSGEWRPKGAWTCKICGKRMKHGGSYLAHMRSHRGEKPFKCEECGKGFGRKDYLSEHRRIHTGVRKYGCVFCERGFQQQHHLFSHLRVHTEEKPYFCVVTGCGESFRHSSSLKSHRGLIHLKKH